MPTKTRPVTLRTLRAAARRRVSSEPAMRVRQALAQRLDPPVKDSDNEKNPLAAYFYANKGRRIHKWLHYFDIYHRHFQQYRDKAVTIVEFGVSHGGSLQMWKSYFGPQARIIGVDINPKCAALEEPQIEIVIGDQDDREFLRSLAATAGTGARAPSSSTRRT